MTVDSYIQSFPSEVQTILHKLRQVVNETVPSAVEGFAYQMPSYKLNGKPLIYFAAFKEHIGLYATPAAHSFFAKELSSYKQGKGSVQFPLNKPIPYDLIKQIIDFKAKECLKK